MNKKNFYITTTLPYVNSNPHIGFALEVIRADVIARYNKLIGKEVFFNTGTDEHGQKIFDKAKELNIDVQEYVDNKAQVFKDLMPALNILPEVNFIRTTDQKHIESAQAFWMECFKKGDIYKKSYKTKYCIGCELEKTDSDLENGKCPLHPNNEIQLIEEENYFFKFSKYQKPLLEFYKNNPKFVIPDFRFNEIKAFVERGLEDFSVSRLKSKMSWGVPVSNDSDHVMYVWFDALVNYISAIGWPDDMEGFNKWWPVVQYAGKDNLRQQSAMWQAMLMSAGIPTSKQIIINGFVTGSGGIKMSKSLGNTVDPFDIVKEYGVDALRYFVLKELHPFEDSPFTVELFKESYNTGLVNGLGNLVSRIMKMAVTNNIVFEENISVYNSDYKNDFFDKFNLQEAIKEIWNDMTSLDVFIQNEQPFKKIKNNLEDGKKDMLFLVKSLYIIALKLEPFLPETSLKIQNLIKNNQMPESPLFPRKD